MKVIIPDTLTDLRHAYQGMVAEAKAAATRYRASADYARGCWAAATESRQELDYERARLASRASRAHMGLWMNALDRQSTLFSAYYKAL